MNNKEYTIAEAEKIAPKECWAAEYTEDERIRAIQTFKSEAQKEAVEQTIEKYKEWVLPNLTEQDKKWMEEDSINVLADVMGWCVICNKANGKLTEEGICGDCL